MCNKMFETVTVSRWKRENYRRHEKRFRLNLAAKVMFCGRIYEVRLTEMSESGGRLKSKAPLFMGALFDLYVLEYPKIWATCQCMHERDGYGFRYYLSTQEEMKILRELLVVNEG